MISKTFLFTLFVTTVFSRHMPRFTELEEDDQQFLRAAYETSNYDHDEYDDDMPLSKLDLLDGKWALKAKIKELKAFNKAMIANLLATKLKIKELIENGEGMKKHYDKKKTYYQGPSHPQYAETQYAPQHVHDPYYGQ